MSTANNGSRIHEDVIKTLQTVPTIKHVFITPSGKHWFFNEQTADKNLEKYDKLSREDVFKAANVTDTAAELKNIEAARKKRLAAKRKKK